MLRGIVVEDLLALHERQEAQREFRRLIGASLVGVHLQLGSMHEAQQRHRAAPGDGPAADHVAHHHRVHEAVMGDR
jgi:hypothetical protein